MKTKLRTIICIMLTALICLSLFACAKGSGDGNSTSESSNVTENNPDYTLKSENGEHYIVFDDISKYEKNDGSSGMIMGELEFSSMRELKDTVTNNKLSDYQKKTVARAFKRNDSNEVLTCDFNNLYVPTTPAEASIDSVYWSGQSYAFSMLFADNACGYLYYITRDSYDNLYRSEFEDFFENKLINISEIDDSEEGKTVIYYSTSTGHFKRIRYTLQNNKTMVVDKKFCLEINHDMAEASDTVPQSVNLYCNEGNSWYRLYLYNLTTDPTDEWLLDFGITPYVESDAVVK